MEGLTVAPLKGLTIGKIDQDYLLGGTATGTAVFADVDYVPPQVYEVDKANAAESGTETGLGVGLAAGEGTAEGLLIIEGGSVIMPRDGLRTQDTSQFIVGGAFAFAAAVRSSAIGHLEVNRDGGQTTIQSTVLDVGRAVVEAGDSASADSVGSATIRNAEIAGLLRAAISRCSAPSSTATSTVTASSILSSTITDRELDLGIADANEPGCRAVANIEAFDVVDSQLVAIQGGDLLATSPGGIAEGTIDFSVTDSQITATSAITAGARGIDIADIESFGAGASVTGVITADLTRVVGDTEGDELDVGTIQGAGGATASGRVELDLIDSQLTVGLSKLGEVENFGGDGTNLVGRIDVSMSQGSALVGTDLLLGVAESSASGVADVEAVLELTDSSVSFSGEVIVGRFLGTSTDAGNRASATLTSRRSLVSASALRVATINEPSNPLEGVVILNPSLLRAEQFDLGVDGDLFLHLEGTARVTAATIGAAGTYAAIDALDATLEGEIVARFGFVPTPGTTSFDLVVSDSLTALDDTTATLTVAGLDPGFTVDFFGVVEDGTDVLRLTVSGSPSADLAISLSDSPDPVSPGAPVSYTLVASNLGPNPAASVTVSQNLPPEAAWQSAAGEGWACHQVGGIVTCTRPALALGAAPPISVAVTAPDVPGTLDSTASITAATTDLATANNFAAQTTTVVSASNVSGTKEVAGDLVLTNSAADAQVNDPINPEFTDTLPAELTLLDASADSGTASITGATVRWDGRIEGDGGAVVLSIDAQIAGSALNATIVNQGDIFFDSDGDGTNDTVAPTDDPDLPGPDDPTVFVAGSIVDVPTLHGLGMSALALLLALCALGALRRR